MPGIRTIVNLVLFASLLSSAQEKFDYLIVGGGTAGLALANRLTENPSVQVLVIEAGGDGLGNVNVSDFTRLSAAVGTEIDWSYPIEPLIFANNRSLGREPRGKVLGGSSTINGDVWDRGDAREYNLWETLGNPQWNFDTLFPLSKKSEKFFPPNVSDNIDFVLKDHGLRGNIATSYPDPAPPIHDDIISSIVNMGGKKSPDLAGGFVDGVSHATNAALLSNRTRSTAAAGYYFPFTFRQNLQVTLFSTVTKIIWQSELHSNDVVASGAQYVDVNGMTHTVNASSVILSAGAFGSPGILERSGVGNKTYLTTLGIESVVDLPGVGENLQEQVIATLQWTLTTRLTLSDTTPFLVNMESLQKTIGTGNLATLEPLLGIKPSGLSDAQWKVNLKLFNLTSPWVEGLIILNNPASGNSILNWFPISLHQQSRGSVHIVSTNASVFPKLQYNLFESPLDTFVMAASAKRVQKIVSIPPLSNWISAPLTPPAGITTIPDLTKFMLDTAGPAHHPVGTALMSPREIGGVVDSRLKVYGTKNVYVVDASVIPIQPAAHTLATVYALAERAAQLLKA